MPFESKMPFLFVIIYNGERERALEVERTTAVESNLDHSRYDLCALGQVT